MKNNIKLSLFLIWSFTASLNAQPTRSTPVKKWNLEAFRFNAAYHIHSSTLTDFGTVLNLASNAADLTLVDNFEAYKLAESSRQGNLGNLILQASVLYSPRDRKDATLINRRRMAQFGLSFQNMLTYESGYSLSEKVDTITTTRDYYVKARQNLLQAESAYLFTTDPDRSVYLYGGAGLNLGFSVSSSMEENTGVTITNSETEKTTYTPSLKDIKTKPYLNVVFAVPFGFHARIYKNWGALADFRYNFMVINNFGAGSTVRSGLQLGLGIKYTIGTFPDKKEEDESEL
jgi:hypothetical protein